MNISCDILFYDNLIPNFLFIEAAGTNMVFTDLPSDLIISNRRFELLCGTVRDTDIIKIGHFLGIFNLNNNLYLLDGLGQEKIQNLMPYTDNLKRMRHLDGIIKNYRNSLCTSLYYLTN